MNPLEALGVAAPIVQKILSYIPDPEQRAKAQTELMDFFSKSDDRQANTNTAEAANASVFVSGWRPAIGWVCALALFYQYLLVPISMWAGFVVGHPIPKPPVLDDSLWQLMFGMLGMGGLRTFEKLKGVASK